MKLDKIKFAKLMHYLAWHCKADIDDNDLSMIDNIIDIDISTVNEYKVEALMRAIHAGEKSNAIKAYRDLTGMPLKESEDAVEKYLIEASIGDILTQAVSQRSSY